MFTRLVAHTHTPFDMKKSLAQNRPVYDLTRVNVPRESYYSRLDMLINKDLRIRASHLDVYAGVDNVLNRSNFLSYAGMPRFNLHSAKRVPVGTLWQTPIFPNFGVRFIFR
jgi:hypothetical protein